MSIPHPGLCRTASVEALLNTLEHERHARAALLEAFVDDLEAVSERVPESTRTLLARARRGDLPESEIPALVSELRASLHDAA
jgi:hypothetical protein